MRVRGVPFTLTPTLSRKRERESRWSLDGDAVSTTFEEASGSDQRKGQHAAQ